MSDKRFTKQESTIEKYMFYDNNKENAYFITCDEGTINAIVDLLNEQQATISALKEENEQLRQKLKEKEEDERLYAKQIVKLNKEAKEVLNFKTLGSDY